MRFLRQACYSCGLLSLLLLTPLAAQEENSPETPQAPPAEAPTETESDARDAVETIDGLIYVPFRNLKSVFNNGLASAIIPAADYLVLLKNQKQPSAGNSPGAVITRADYTAAIENDVARIQVTLTINVFRSDGWVRLPLQFGDVAVGRVTSEDDENTVLQGIERGKYQLLLRGSGQKSVTLELLAAVTTSPEARSFTLNCPAVGINNLQVTVPDGDQTVAVDPVQVLLPSEGSDKSKTVIRAALGVSRQFTVRWFPKAGSKPQMDLLSSVSNETRVLLEPELIQTSSVFTWEILRGQMTEAILQAPADARIIDVVAHTGRIQSWDAQPANGQQQIRIQLLSPVTDQLRVEIQTERDTTSDTLQLLGRTDEGFLQSVHADGVVRESGRLTVAVAPGLTMVPQTKSGVKRVSTKDGQQASGPSWEFSGSRGSLLVRVKPVEPRLLAEQTSNVILTDDEVRLQTRINYTIERAGVFELYLRYPESLTIDSVRADGMSEFNVDRGDGTIRLALTNRRQGTIGVDIQAHHSFDSTANNVETTIPSIEPLNVKRTTGQVCIWGPQFLDVITIEEQLSGLTPARDRLNTRIGQATAVSAWNFTQQPWTLAVRTSPRPAQIDAIVATTAHIEPEIVRFNSKTMFHIHNAGIDTFRLAVPESIADDVRFRSLNRQQKIQQRDRGDAADGWVTWTLVLQNEVTGRVQIAVDWDRNLPPARDDATRTFTAEPVRVLPPFPDDGQQPRRVTLTQVRGELRLLRHESLSIDATAVGDSAEAIDVHELEQLPHEGFLAFRYFAQPASTSISVEQHEVHEAAATVVSRAAIEIVTQKQRLAGYRCRYRITSSERQRLRVDVPEGSELQAPTLNQRRTTFKAASGVESTEGFEAYYIDISREATSDQSFLLAFQLRCPIVNAEGLPFEGQGGRQILRTPQIGEGSDTVVQETRVGIWTPKDISIFGQPEYWTALGQRNWSLFRPLQSGTTHQAAQLLNGWISENRSSGDFADQGQAVVFRTLGRRTELRIGWWNRPFLVLVVSGALVLIGLVLRRTSWENRITIVLLAIVGTAIWHLYDGNAAFEIVNAASIGILAVAGIWLTTLLTGSSAADNDSAKTDPPDNAPRSTQEDPPDETTSSEPPSVVTPAPGVREVTDDLMGGKE